MSTDMLSRSSPVDPVPVAPQATRLVTYNVYNGRNKKRDTAAWAQMLTELVPDLLCVQEAPDPHGSWGDGFGGTLTDPACLWAAVPGMEWGSGLAVQAGHLTPLPIPPDFTGWVVGAQVEGRAWPGIGRAPVWVYSIHAPSRPKRSNYVAEVGRILDFIAAAAPPCPLILTGDFNVVTGLREPEQHPATSGGERKLLKRLGTEFGLVPCWQTAHPGEPLARTLRWLHRSDSPPYHCDGLFMPAAWTGALHSCDVLEDAAWQGRSDHNPVVATLQPESADG